MQKIISTLFLTAGITFFASTALAQTGAAKPAVSPTPVKLPVLSQVLSAMAGQRRELTGTGLSVQSPEPFLLKQDKPDPLLETQTANVFWTLSHRGIFANVRYVREGSGKSPRHELESTAKMVSETNGSPMPKIVDTTFLGSAAVQFEEEFVDAYDPQKVKRKRRMLTFGTAGELTTIQISYPAADTQIATLADQIFKSFQKTGAVAQAISKMPPVNWEYITHKGLKFEVPDAKTEIYCKPRITSPLFVYNTISACYAWDGLLIVDSEYRIYNGPVPTALQAAETYIQVSKGIDRDIQSTFQREYEIEKITIAGADAVNLKIYTLYGTTGSIEEMIFIHRGKDLWTVRTFDSLRRNYTKGIVRRIAASITF